MIDRRGFLLGLAAASITAPARASTVHRIGILDVVDAAANAANLAAFRRALAERGHVEGRNLVIHYRSADGRPERLTDLAAELAALKVDVIVTRGTPAALSAKQATATIPIVMASSGEPVAEGIVASLARPGGNVTGFSLVVPAALGSKKLHLLREAVPGLSRVGLLWNQTNIYAEPLVRDALTAAPTMGMQIKTLEIDRAASLESLFEAALLARIDALVAMHDSLMFSLRSRIVEFAAMSRLPAIYGLSEFVQAGGLMAYGPDRRDLFRRAAEYVHRIFEGASPAELPIEPPTVFELVINLKTARTLGLDLPPSMLSRAEHVA
jgi:putative tryptophan/tyrosine transport system substrate-binding protein